MNVAGPKCRKSEGEYYERVWERPINGSVDGCSINGPNQHEADSMRERERKTEIQNQIRKSRTARRCKDSEGGRPRPWSAYITGINSGASHGICRWAVAGTRVNGCMQEQ